MVRKCSYFVRLAWKKVINRSWLTILFVLMFVYLGAVFTVMAYEEIGFGAATDMILPAFLSELGVMESPFLAVRISLVAGLVASLTLLGVITGKITGSVMESIKRGGSVRKMVKYSGHIIICGWNSQGKQIVKHLLSPDQKQHRQIVVLAKFEQRPVPDERVDCINGDPTQEESLKHAGVMKAHSVIVLPDLTKLPNDADAEALMVTLAVESLHPTVHTCVQLLNSANYMHLERAHADEIICLDQLGGNLVVASALNHGLSHVVSELLTFNLGSEFYRYDGNISKDIMGKEFAEAVQTLANRHMLLLAVETDDSEEKRSQLSTDKLYEAPEKEGKKRVIVVNPNPRSRYQICQNDSLFVIAESEPIEL